MNHSNNKTIWSSLGLLILAGIFVFFFSTNNKTNPINDLRPTVTPYLTVNPSQQAASTSANSQVLGQRIKISGCVTVNGVQDKDCTPGAIIQGVTADQICVFGYSQSVRNVPESLKNQVYQEYGITTHNTGEYEVDHLISLELGGSNDISNLWPEAAVPTPGFHEKDKVENYLHQQVCSGKMSLQEAQQKITNDWKEVY